MKYLYLDKNSSLAAGSVLHTAFSNVSIVNSKFTDNTAEIGGVLFAHNSSFYITRSELSNNRANFGGVMVTSGSTVVIDDRLSTFSENAAEGHGGTIIAYNDSFSISSTKFTDNRAE